MDDEGNRRKRWIEANGQDDWDVSDSEKPKKTAAPTTTAAPPKKKLTLKQKLAEKERLAAERVSVALEGVDPLPTPRHGHRIDELNWGQSADEIGRRERSHRNSYGTGPTSYSA